MIVSDFIVWLQTQDQDATVKVVKAEHWIGEGIVVSSVEFNLDHVVFSKRDRTLLLGED